MLADAEAVATSLERVGHPFDLGRMDAVLLRVIRDEPGRMVEIFDALTSRNPAPRVLRFLDERPGLLDLLRIIAGMPSVSSASPLVGDPRPSEAGSWAPSCAPGTGSRLAR
jgi:hypothetical protein